MLEGRFDPEILRAFFGAQVLTSDRPHDRDELATDPVVMRIRMSGVGLVAVICLLSLA